MINDRQSFRLRKQIELIWTVPEQKIEGAGLIYNISRSGALFVTDKLFDPDHDLIMGFRVEQVPPFPSKGKLIWFKKVGQANARFQCGAKFSNELAASQAWITWMEENILKLADVASTNILENLL